MADKKTEQFKTKADRFIFRLHCDLADHTVELEKARNKRNIFDVDKEEAFVNYIEKLILKANSDLL
jgi:hypothetical protein